MKFLQEGEGINLLIIAIDIPGVEGRAEPGRSIESEGEVLLEGIF